MDLEFKNFTDARISATKDAWMADASSGLAFSSEVSRLIEWADQNRVPTELDAAGYGVFHKHKSVALGICEVIVQRKSARSKWVKMLRLHLKPSIDAELQTGSPDDAMEVFIQSITGVIGLQMAHSATTLKVYGRTNAQLTFLKALVGHIQKKFADTQEHSIKSTIEGRFLTIVIS